MPATIDGIHTHLATLCAYPGAGYLDAARAALTELLDMRAAWESEQITSSENPFDALQTTIQHFQIFLDTIKGFDIHELEELYTRTFDINPVASLDLGWHLFGENYERGKFLVHMRGLLRNNGITESTELPDHLTHVLHVLSAMDLELAERFVSEKVLPALNTILDGFAGKENVYEHFIYAVKGYLTTMIHTRYGSEHHD